MEQRQPLLALVLTFAVSACTQAPEYRAENRLIEDDLPGSPGAAWPYALGAEVEFRVEEFLEGAETRIELSGDIFEGETQEDGSVRALASAEGEGEVLVYIDEELVHLEHLVVKAPTRAYTASNRPDPLSFGTCFGCGQSTQYEMPRYARGSQATRDIVYQTQVLNERLRGRAISDGDYIVPVEAGDTLELDTETEGRFELPIRAGGQELTILEYTVVEADSIRIINFGGGAYLAQVLDADGERLDGWVTWTIDGEEVEADDGYLRGDDVDGAAEIGARVGGVEVTLSI